MRAKPPVVGLGWPPSRDHGDKWPPSTSGRFCCRKLAKPSREARPRNLNLKSSHNLHSIVNFLIAFYTIHLLATVQQFSTSFHRENSILHKKTSTFTSNLLVFAAKLENEEEQRAEANEPYLGDHWLALSELAANREQAKLDRLLLAASGSVSAKSKGDSNNHKHDEQQDDESFMKVSEQQQQQLQHQPRQHSSSNNNNKDDENNQDSEIRAQQVVGRKQRRPGRHKTWRNQDKPEEVSEGESRKRNKRSRRHFNSGHYFYDPSLGNAMQSSADRPLVATRKGLIRGVTQKIFTGKFVDAFLGIPFAQPPVGRYRFKHPQAINPWQGELDASKLGNSCYQVNDTFFGPTFGGTQIWNANTPLQEDCLYLNIWTPFGVANTTASSGLGSSGGGGGSQASGSSGYGFRAASKRPVLVWIYGGSFYSGTSSLALYEGGALASEEDIIVVSMNYRVSALGFLYFGRPDAPGNAGLFDQLMALQWINDNIDQFGGDPNRVTIFGESSGAVSVSYHLLSPLSRNLFQQAILQSGAATCPWGSMDTREIMANGLQLAALLNCPSNNTDLDAVIECLLQADPMALVSQEVGQTRTVLNFPFVPVVDGSFLLEPPRESLQKSNFKRAKIMLGSNHDEGNFFLVYLPQYSHCPKGGEEGATGSVDSLSKMSTQLSSGDKGLGEGGKLPNSNSRDDEFSQGETSGDSSVVSEAFRRDFKKINQGARYGNGESLESFNLVLNSAAVAERPRQSGSTQRGGSQGQQVGDGTGGGGGGSQSSVSSSTTAISGTNGTLDSQKPCKPNEFISFTRDDFIRVLQEDLNPFAASPIGKEAIIFEYTNWINPLDPVSNYDAIDKIVGDYYFTCNVNEFAQSYAQAGNSVYMYYFKQRSTVSAWPKWMGVLHGDEINFIFGEPLNPAFNYTEKEVELSRRMMRYWANFAKFG